jgi:hypothetical protein
MGGQGQPWLVVRRTAAGLPRYRVDADFGDRHGGGGPVPIRRSLAADLSPWQRAFADAALAAGHRWQATTTSQARSVSARLPATSAMACG